ncbi:hypothetical protein KP509_03G014300 [Ceratopteris richardii]|uniref:Uncharacterized protein n=1 Tax=Ceratopteris richardii TaxID=49495 RepID=A0A8T2V959_CERRI|nr:hypothetical protein KP509_03G014300 [Ceratopteris richardii]KAH7440858.1 hypothetical protein KP509_03G014300 [Ceratopteris richardii]KAH7440859.1 hypothetical protein KP509_03G014300 [Ceratopteris richardii]
MERDVEQAVIALKKGAYLLKYGRRGKPKFCPFRLSNDGALLIWFSGKEEKQLKLSSVSRIVPGQRTAIFQRYPRPDKEYQSFSLIFEGRSLDLICKDKEEAEVWFTGLRALISGGQTRRWIRNEEGLTPDACSPVGYTRKSSPLGSPLGSIDILNQVVGDTHRVFTPYGSPPPINVGKLFPEDDTHTAGLKMYFFESSYLNGSLHSVGSDMGSDSMHSQTRASSNDIYRVSLSSAVSSSSQGSGQDDADALGDVYLWGEGIGDGILGGGTYRVGQSLGAKVDAVLPKAMESAVVLDVQQVACGGRHAVLVTKQGEVFSWGEESGGRLGHGVDADISQPQLVEMLTSTTIEFVSCGEYSSCAVSISGELFSWGDGTHGTGLLGQGNDVGHWLPKRVAGPLTGLRVVSVSCGPWHTALVTSFGQLFTFGDGTFGVLGHGDCNSTFFPREVDSLKGLRTVRVSCGVWHSAAVVEVMVGSSGSSNCSSGKLFTWGDGDKGRLGHGDKEQKLVPTCVAALVEYNFRNVVCGHSLTVGLTLAGQVFTMGSPVYGQLGEPFADGKVPKRVEGKLRDVFVEEIACGAFHVCALTSKGEVYTWGKGANGRLGHGDYEDRKVPTLVDALKDKQVKSIACGTSMTAAICLHKWVSGADQSICSGCKQPFGFTRKRHNCYNCGLVYCHSCSSKKAMKASMAPNPSKPYRVCDPCYIKLKKAAEGVMMSNSCSVNKRVSGVKPVVDNRDPKLPRSQAASSKVTALEQFKINEYKSYSKKNKRSESTSSRVSPVRSAPSQQFTYGRRQTSASVPQSRIVSRATSPIASRRSSPPRSTTPTAALVGIVSPRSGETDLIRTKESLANEVLKLRSQVENLTRRCQLQDAELKHSAKQLNEALRIAEEEGAKCKAAKDVIKSLTAQLKGMAERVPGDAYHNNRSVTSLHSEAAPAMQTFHGSVTSNGSNQHHISHEGSDFTSNGNTPFYAHDSHGYGRGLAAPPISDRVQHESYDSHHKSDNSSRSTSSHPLETEYGPGIEWVEQDEPGVYITLVSLPGGGRDLKRVRFSRKRFSERQAEIWWQENKARVHELYNVRLLDRSTMGYSAASSSENHS